MGEKLLLMGNLPETAPKHCNTITAMSTTCAGSPRVRQTARFRLARYFAGGMGFKALCGRMWLAILGDFHIFFGHFYSY
jgi:hypothetical protein